MSGKARTIEALVGAGVGALGGAVAGGLSYESKDPKEWTDEHGLTYARAHTSEEKAERRKRMLTAALVGAGVGTGASLGGSAFRRMHLDSAEAAAAPELIRNRLGHLRKMVDEAEAGVSDVDQFGRRLMEPEVLKKRMVLQDQEHELHGLLGKAREARSDSPWGGYTQLKDKGPREDLTHEGRVNRHFKELRARHGLPGIVDEEFFKQLLHKSASISTILADLPSSAGKAFFSELREISSHARG